jgi:hypothetical protein
MKNLLTIFVSLSLSLILLSNGGSIAFQQEANAQNMLLHYRNHKL